jgi:hypothetical protein|tara:strand:+ start:1880 stop:2011 length:132 start_codon:yes stop_codon:yes gene_type:complete
MCREQCRDGKDMRQSLSQRKAAGINDIGSFGAGSFYLWSGKID